MLAARGLATRLDDLVEHLLRHRLLFEFARAVARGNARKNIHDSALLFYLKNKYLSHIMIIFDEWHQNPFFLLHAHQKASMLKSTEALKPDQIRRFFFWWMRSAVSR